MDDVLAYLIFTWFSQVKHTVQNINYCSQVSGTVSYRRFLSTQQAFFCSPSCDHGLD